MRLTLVVLNQLVDTLALDCAGGSLAIYAADPRQRPLEEPLVTVPLPVTAFPPAVDGRAIAERLPSVEIAATGEATWAQLLNNANILLADLRVRQQDDPNAQRGDLLLDRTDLQRGGRLELTGFVLSVPVRT